MVEGGLILSATDHAGSLEIPELFLESEEFRNVCVFRSVPILFSVLDFALFSRTSMTSVPDQFLP